MTIEMQMLSVAASRLELIKRVVERVWRAIEAEYFYHSPSTMSCPSYAHCAVCQAWCG